MLSLSLSTLFDDFPTFSIVQVELFSYYLLQLAIYIVRVPGDCKT